MNTIALLQNSQGIFDIKFENGTIVEELLEESVAKHNLYCFGRLDANATVNPELRRGFSGSFLEDSEFFSLAWAYYMEGNVTFDSITAIITEFNKACARDYNAGLIEKKIIMKSGTRLDKNSLSFRISIGENTQSFTVNI